MNENEPPQRLTSELIQLDHGLKQIERAQHPGLQRAPDSLPVLEAFQSFLQAEQKRARRRLVSLVAVALLLLLLISGASIAVVVLMSGNVQDRVDRFAIASQQLASHLADARQQSSTAVLSMQSKLNELEQQLAGTSSNREEQTSAAVKEATAAYQDALVAMRAEIETMRTANNDVATALAAATNQWSGLDQRLRDARKARARRKPASSQPEVASTAAHAPQAHMVQVAPSGTAPDGTGSSEGSATRDQGTPSMAKMEPGTKTAVEPSTNGARAQAPKQPSMSGPVGPSQTLVISPPGKSSPVKWRLPSIPE